MINTAEYTEKLGQFVQGNLPVEAWMEYCQKLLSEILEFPEVQNGKVR